MQEGIKARLRDMSLVDVIQVLNLGRRTAVVNIGSEQGGGRIGDTFDALLKKAGPRVEVKIAGNEDKWI